MPRCKFCFCKKHFNRTFSEKGTISLNNISFYPEAKSKNINHRRCFIVLLCFFSKEKKILHLSCRIHFSKYNTGKPYFTPSRSHTVQQVTNIYSVLVRDFSYTSCQENRFTMISKINTVKKNI